MKKNILLFIMTLFLIPLNGFTHARLKADGILKPRNNSVGLKTGPCGDVARTGSFVTLTAGQKITLTWEETVQHPGYFEFAISQANDQNFTRLLVVPDNQDDRNTLPHQYSQEFTVPNITCEACTFQMIQVMTENPASPRNYYSCADIKIIAGATPPAPMPAPVPAPPVPAPPAAGGETPPAESDFSHSDCYGSP